MRLALLGALVVASLAQAQPRLTRVNSYETPGRHQFELTLRNAGVVDSSGTFRFFGTPRPTQNAWIHALEVEYGATSHLALAAYLVTANAEGGGFQFTEVRLEARYRFVQKQAWPVDLALYAEYVFARPQNGNDELELRLILEKDLGDIRLDLNPILEKETSGATLRGFELGYAAGIYYRRLCWLQPGVELLGKVGELMRPHAAAEQEHYIFGAIDLYLFNQNLRWHLAVGGGLTPRSDEVVVRSLLTWQPPKRMAFRQR